jgi:SAM-dependent methyltransferase
MKAAKVRKSFEEALEDNPLRPFVRDFMEILPLRRLVEAGRMPVALQVACLRGDSSAQLLRRFDIGRLVAVDKDHKQVELAKQLHPDSSIDFRVKDIPDLGFGDGSFDAVFNLAELHNYVDWRRGLAEMARVLKPGGILVMNDLVAESFSLGLGPYFRKRTVHPYEVMMREVELKEELGRCGLETLRFERKNPLGLLRYVVLVARKKPAGA